MAALIGVLMLVTAGDTRAQSEADSLAAAAHQVLLGFFKHPEWEGVRTVVGASKGILIVPSFSSGSLILGYEEGTGVILERHGDQWSDPVFVKLSQTSIGFQAGVKKSELLMVILTRQAVKDLAAGVSRVGGSGGFALGSIGVGASGGGGVSEGLQTLAVSTSEGLAVGGGMANVTVSLIDKFNRSAYGDGFDMAKVLAGSGGAYAEAKLLRGELAKAVEFSRED